MGGSNDVNEIYDNEKTLLIIKPDGVQRGFIGEIIQRIENRGLKVVGLKMVKVSKELAEAHYAVHKGQPFYPGLVEFLTISPVVVMAVQGRNAVRLVRNTMGVLEPAEASPGSIRGDLGISKSYNLVHGSDAHETGIEEVERFFSDDEIFEYDRDLDNWIKHDI